MAVFGHSQGFTCLDCNGRFLNRAGEVAGLCRDCFRKRQEAKPIKERLLDLEIAVRALSQHQHVELARF